MGGMWGDRTRLREEGAAATETPTPAGAIYFFRRAPPPTEAQKNR